MGSPFLAINMYARVCIVAIFCGESVAATLCMRLPRAGQPLCHSCVTLPTFSKMCPCSWLASTDVALGGTPFIRLQYIHAMYNRCRSPPHVYVISEWTFWTMMAQMHPLMDISPSFRSGKSPLGKWHQRRSINPPRSARNTRPERHGYQVINSVPFQAVLETRLATTTKLMTINSPEPIAENSLGLQPDLQTGGGGGVTTEDRQSQRGVCGGFVADHEGGIESG